MYLRFLSFFFSVFFALSLVGHFYVEAYRFEKVLILPNLQLFLGTVNADKSILAIPLTVFTTPMHACIVLEHYTQIANVLDFSPTLQRLRNKLNLPRKHFRKLKQYGKLFESSSLLFEFTRYLLYARLQSKKGALITELKTIDLSGLNDALVRRYKSRQLERVSFLFKDLNVKGEALERLWEQINEKMKNFVAMVMIEKLKQVLRESDVLGLAQKSLLDPLDDDILFILEHGKVKHITLRPSIENIYAVQKIDTLVLPIDMSVEPNYITMVQEFHDQFIKLNKMDSFLKKFVDSILRGYFTKGSIFQRFSILFDRCGTHLAKTVDGYDDLFRHFKSRALPVIKSEVGCDAVLKTTNNLLDNYYAHNIDLPHLIKIQKGPTPHFYRIPILINYLKYTLLLKVMAMEWLFVKPPKEAPKKTLEQTFKVSDNKLNVNLYLIQSILEFRQDFKFQNVKIGLALSSTRSRLVSPTGSLPPQQPSIDLSNTDDEANDDSSTNAKRFKSANQERNINQDT